MQSESQLIPLIPYEIIEQIAKTRPGAMWVCLRLCRAVHNILKPQLPELQKHWLWRTHYTCKPSQYCRREPIITFDANPNGGYHGKFEVSVDHYDRNKPIARIFTGYFHNGVPHGRFIRYGNDGSVISDINYDYGVLHGQHTTVSYETNNDNDEKITIECNYKNGVLDGEYRKSINDTLVYKCNYINGVLHGDEIKYNTLTDGIVRIRTRRHYVNGKRHGWERKYDCNYRDSLSSITYYHEGNEIMRFYGGVADTMDRLRYIAN